MEQIANARRDIRPRVMQVAQVMRDARANAEPHFLTSPQAITIACLLASQPDDRPVDMRFGELLDRWLTAACGPDGTYVIDRRALKAIALEAVRQAQQSVKMKRVEEVLDENGLACQSQNLEEDLDRLAGIVQRPQGQGDTTRSLGVHRPQRLPGRGSRRRLAAGGGV